MVVRVGQKYCCPLKKLFRVGCGERPSLIKNHGNSRGNARKRDMCKYALALVAGKLQTNTFNNVHFLLFSGALFGKNDFLYKGGKPGKKADSLPH